MDLQSGYWQVEIEENSKEYTAFVTPGFDLFEFNRLPFGLCNTPGTFQDLTDRVFQGLKWANVMVYLDDVIVFSDTFEEHLSLLKEVFQRIKLANLSLKTYKCTFAQEEVKILGHVVNRTGIKPDNEKLKAIQAFPHPKNRHQLHSFLGLANYYRKFIRNFSIIAHPLHKLTKTISTFTWATEQENSFQELKQKLTSDPLLTHFDPRKPCELRTDACNHGLGVILLQQQDNDMHPIAYASQSLTKAEINCTITEQEALAVIWGLTYFRHFIYGRKVSIVTDHHALCFLKQADQTTGCLTQWAVKLQEFEHDIIYKSGKKHLDADCLSRNPRICGNS